MLLRILKNSTTAGYLFILFFTLLAWLPQMANTPQLMIFDDHPMPLFSLITDYVPVDSSGSIIISFIILIIAGLYLISLNSDYSIIRSKTLLPTFFFLMTASSIEALHRIHPALLAMVFFLPALDKLLASYKTERLSYNYFEASFLIGAGSLMYFNLIYYIIIVWVALLILRPVIWREWIFSILGIITPWFFFAAGFYLVNESLQPVLDLVIANFITNDPYDFIQMPEIIFFSFLLLLIIFASRHILQSMSKMKVLPRKIFVLFFWIWSLSIAMYLFIKTANIELIIPAAIPVSFLLGHYFQSMRPGFWNNLFLWLFAAGAVFLAWFPYVFT